jgi:hypothetical protein
MRPDDLVHLASATNPAEAHLWHQALQSEGIRSQAVGDYLEAGIGDVPGIQAEIWVRRQDLERAREVLAAHQAKASDEEE